MLEGPPKYDNPHLLEYIRKHVIEPPSTEPYNLSRNMNDVISEKSNVESEIFYRNFTRMLFDRKRNGFFVEAGALDGQTMSNTLWLERKRGWHGLLIEPDPSNYIVMKQRQRKAWTVNGCISIDKYPKTEHLYSSNVLNKHKPRDGRERAMSFIKREGKEHFVNFEGLSLTMHPAQCFPLESLLLALNTTKVDLFSLDVEGFEEAIIQNFDFSRFNIEVIYIEWWKQKKLFWLREFMRTKDYTFVANRESDIIFVKKDTETSKLVDKLLPNRKLNIFVYDVKEKQ